MFIYLAIHLISICAYSVKFEIDRKCFTALIFQKNYNFYNYLLGKDLISFSVAENDPTIKLQQNTL